ncbi:hypothetical protein CIW52_20540 [Mycolicibacterium sp. P9-64]|nr:hypothetical protein CIW52_20540 [Mycolicibacterium sp. P9-64]
MFAHLEMVSAVRGCPPLIHYLLSSAFNESIDLRYAEDVVIDTVEGGHMTKGLAILIGPERPYETSEAMRRTAVHAPQRSGSTWQARPRFSDLAAIAVGECQSIFRRRSHG